MASITVEMPTISKENSRQAIDELTNYITLMSKQLEFNLSHISSDDFDSDTVASMESTNNMLADMERKINFMEADITELFLRITNAASSITEIYNMLSRIDNSIFFISNKVSNIEAILINNNLT